MASRANILQNSYATLIFNTTLKKNTVKKYVLTQTASIIFLNLELTQSEREW